MTLTEEELHQISMGVAAELQKPQAPQQESFVAKSDPRPEWQRCAKVAEEYRGEIPLSSSGKNATNFVISRFCGVKDRNGTCKQSLLVKAVKNIRWLPDESLLGGQLDYDDQGDLKYLVYCPAHTPKLPQYWDSYGKFIDRPERATLSHEAPRSAP